MPFYDYVCRKCRAEVEYFQSMSDPPIVLCPQCKNKTLERAINIPFKGQVEYRDAREMYEKKIKPEAKEIAQKIREGDQEAAADIFGENKIVG